MRIIFEPGDVVYRTLFAKATPQANENSGHIVKGEIYAYIMGIKSEESNILLESVMVVEDQVNRKFLATYVGEVDVDPDKVKDTFPFTIDGYKLEIGDEDRLTLPLMYMWESIQSTKEFSPEIVVYGYKTSFSRYGREMADKVAMLGDKMRYRHLEFASDNILGISVGTNGHQWGNSGRGTFGHISLRDMSCTGWAVDILGTRDEPKCVDIYFEGDAELDIAIAACEQIAAKLRELADNKVRAVDITEYDK